MTKGLDHLNTLSREEAEAELLKCCGSTRWARRMADRRPFRDLQELEENADRIWWDLERQDWFEAFSQHPKIGERAAALIGDAETHRWSQEEQSGTRSASQETLAALVNANRAYEDKFGYIFIVCATGKSSEEMLTLLNERLNNNPETELRIAAEEQRRIMHLRLKKLVNSLESRIHNQMDSRL